MPSEKFLKIEEIYHAVLEVAPQKRPAFLTNACGDDDDLCREVESLLSFAGISSSLIDTPPIDVAAEMFAKKKTRKIVGTKISHYKILSNIGIGGMGEVFLAQDIRLEREVAIKFINTDLALEKDRLHQFINEAKTASALNHPNIITVHEIGKTKNTPFIATEFIDGKTLRKAISENSLMLAEMLEITLQVAAALKAAHSAGIIHRDIKPENIMLRDDGLVKVLDFGLAKLLPQGHGDTETRGHGEEDNTLIALSPHTQTSLLMGTVAYMSPEQASGKTTDARSDLWSLGVVFYEMYYGKQPFKGKTATEMVTSILKNKPPPLDQNTPPEISRIIKKALQRDRDKRYQTIQDFLLDLKNLKKELEQSQTTEKFGILLSGKNFDTGETQNLETVSTSERILPQAGTPNFSSAEYIFHAIKRRKFGALASLIILITLSISAFLYYNRSPVLTDQDTVLIADFENLTDDTVFTGTLRQGLVLQLAQSPFLRILPEADIKETLRLMKRDADEKITPQLAREICLRQGVKVFITGSFAPSGSNYAVTLQAINAQTGATIISEQNQAESKEQVLFVLGKTVSSLREKLGESLVSIKKYDSPTEVATTSSLEAMRAYSSGMEFYAKGGNKDEAVLSLFELAIKLDPNFALAFRDLARHQFNIGRHAEAITSITKAFELRERTSENERLSIEVLYHQFTANDLEKAAETAEIWKKTFPRFWQPSHALADIYFGLGQFEKAVENGREAVRLNPNFAAAYTNPAGALFRLNRFAEAKELYRQAMANNLDHLAYHFFLFWIGYFENDRTAIQQQLEWMRTHDYKHFALAYESQLALLEGRWKQSLEFSRQARAASEKYKEKDLVAGLLVWDAHTAALFGDCKTAKQRVNEVLPSTKNNILLAEGAFALAMCGQERQALQIADDLAIRFPNDTTLQQLRLPTVRAAAELHRNQPDKALEWLKSTKLFDGQYINFAPFVQGLALLRKGKNAEAATEFQNIHQHPGWFDWTPLVPLSHLWEARALALTGDTTRSIQTYEEFFRLWKDADHDLPILVEAKEEYKRLARSK